MRLSATQADPVCRGTMSIFAVGLGSQSSVCGGWLKPLQGKADLNEAAGAADATRELDGSVYALRLK
jgi:hypothetical protein